ncbi:MAG: YceI family protein [Leeuwenhoekiella sp.]
MKNSVKSVLILAVAFGTASFTNIMTDKVEIKESSVKWEGKKVAGKHNGTINLKEGYFEMENNEITGGKFVIDMTSIITTDLTGESKGQLEGHLKSDDFFGVESYPDATLVITKTTKTSAGYSVTGDLTIKETTEPVSFDLAVNGNTASTELTIDRSKYNVRYGSGSFFDNLGDKTIYDNFTLAIDLKF